MRSDSLEGPNERGSRSPRLAPGPGPNRASSQDRHSLVLARKQDRRGATKGMSVFAAIFAVATTAGSCDRTHIEGTVVPSSLRIRVGESVELTLQVRSDLSAQTRREDWVVEPETLGTIVVDEAHKNARHATFQALSTGQGAIRAYAFYGPQTSPQLVDSVRVEVRAAGGSLAVKPPGVDFCTRLAKAIPGCWCDGPLEQSKVLHLDTAVMNANEATELVRAHVEPMSRSIPATGSGGLDSLDAKALRCSEVKSGYFNCFGGNTYLGTVSSFGEVYRTSCGV